MELTCFACRQEFDRQEIEQHHFPTPKRNGGTLTIPLCQQCHNMIDRYTLEQWPLQYVLAAFDEMGIDGRLLMLKLMSRFVPDGFCFETLNNHKEAN